VPKLSSVSFVSLVGVAFSFLIYAVAGLCLRADFLKDET